MAGKNLGERRAVVLSFSFSDYSLFCWLLIQFLDNVTGIISGIDESLAYGLNL